MEEIPCQQCDSYYGHKKDCSTLIGKSGVAELIVLYEKITELEQKLERCREVVEFYDNQHSYAEVCDEEGVSRVCISSSDEHCPNHSMQRSGGLLARQLKEEMGWQNAPKVSIVERLGARVVSSIARNK